MVFLAKKAIERSFFPLVWTGTMAMTLFWMAKPAHLRRTENSVGRLTSLLGKVEIRPIGEFKWQPAESQTPIQANDIVATGKDSQARLELDGGVTLELPESTQVKILPTAKNSSHELALLHGSLRVISGEAVNSVTQKSAERNILTGSEIKIRTHTHSLNLSDLKGPITIVEGSRVLNQSGQPLTIRSGDKSYMVSDQNVTTKFEDLKAPSAVLGTPQENMETLESALALSVLKESMNSHSKDSTKSGALSGNITGSLAGVPSMPVASDSSAAALEGYLTQKIKDSEQANLEPPKVPSVPHPGAFPRFMPVHFVYWYAGKLRENMGKNWKFALQAKSLKKPLPAPWRAFIQVTRDDSLQKVRLPLINDGGSAVVAQSVLLPLIEGDEKSAAEIQLKIQTGIEAKVSGSNLLNKSKIFLSPGISIVLKKIPTEREFTLYMDNWSTLKRSHELILDKKSQMLRPIHFYDPSLIVNAFPFLADSAFAFTDLKQPIGPPLVYGVRKSRIVAAVHVGDEELLTEKFQELDLDLVFKGPAASFAGIVNQDGLLKLLAQPKELFYVRQGRLLKINKKLFQSHKAAQDYLTSITPYFFNGPVLIIKEKVTH